MAATASRDASVVGTPQHRPLAVVSRSSELLACARTALRLAKAEHEQQSQQLDGTTGPLHPLASVRVEDLHLWRPPPSSRSTSDDALGLMNGQHDVDVDDDYYHSLPAPERAIIDATSVLRAVDLAVSDLRDLVKRRGHTNDPTEEIGRCMNRFQSLTKELLQAAESIKAPPRRGVGRQYRRHYEMVAADIQNRGKERTETFQAALAARSEVLKEQAQRRKMLSASGSGGASNGAAAATAKGAAVRPPAAAGAGVRSVAGSNASRAALAQLDSPLFTMTTGVGAGAASSAKKPYARSSSSAGAAAATTGTAAGPSGSHDGGVRSAPTSSSSYSGQRQRQQQQQPSYGYGGRKQAQPYVSPHHDPYAPAGGGGGGGMRRRGGHQYDGVAAGPTGGGSSYSQFAYSSAASSSSTPYYAQQQQRQEEDESSSSSAAEQARTQIQKRRDARDTRARLDSARQAERAIAELGTMFSKMATLVQSQSEVIDNIEDDVEASLDHVTAGSEEIVKLYHITKGNRGLILKVFALLIFFILFFKLY